MSAASSVLRIVGMLCVLLWFPLAAVSQSLPAKFDPKRNAQQDLAAATALAQAQNKRVLVDVGGEWCVWCHILDRFIAAHPDVAAMRDANYVWLKVNWSPENKNEALLSRWPKIGGYPHLFVLDGDGRLLHSQETGSLESGRDYDKAKFLAFLRAWAPSRAR